jgi:hypothetical protein
MALVKCTKDIKTHAHTKIDELFSERITLAYALKGMTEKQIADEVYARVHTPERIKVMQEMAADISSAYSILGNSNDFIFDAHPAEGIERRITRKFSASIPMLNGFGNSYHAPNVHIFSVEAKQAMIDASVRRKVVIAEREAFKGQFNAAYDKVRSVNELVKLWPAVIELLPPGTMDRINKKLGPREPTNAEAIDAAGLSVHLLKAKVAK